MLFLGSDVNFYVLSKQQTYFSLNQTVPFGLRLVTVSHVHNLLSFSWHRGLGTYSNEVVTQYQDATTTRLHLMNCGSLFHRLWEHQYNVCLLCLQSGNCCCWVWEQQSITLRTASSKRSTWHAAERVLLHQGSSWKTRPNSEKGIFSIVRHMYVLYCMLLLYVFKMFCIPSL